MRFTPAIFFGMGIVAGMAWAWFSYRKVTAGLEPDYLRVAIIMGSELAVAVIAFQLAARRRTRSSASSWAAAFFFGLLVISITVGAYPLIPKFFANDAQLIVGVAVIAALSAAVGWCFARRSAVETGEPAG